MSRKKKIDPRVLTVLLIFILLFFLFSGILLYRQVLHPEVYAQGGVTQKSYNITVPASRGEILDRNGNTFVYNEQMNNLIIDSLTFAKGETEQETLKLQNEVILRLIRLLEKNSESWLDTLPIILNENGTAEFMPNRESDIKWMKSKQLLSLNTYATAQNCFNAFLEEFDIEAQSPEDQRKLASVWYGMRRMGFSNSVPYTFAEDVSVQTIAYIKENKELFSGVEVQTASRRKYTGTGSLAAHLLGIVGAISENEYNEQTKRTEQAIKTAGDDAEKVAELKVNAYKPNDKIGISGIEQAMESYLRGTNGIKTVSVQNDGTLTEKYTVEPKAGGTVITTIDMPLQEIAENSLKKRIMEVTDFTTLANGMAAAGAVVVQDVNTGAVLAAASYPTYSLSTYFEDFDQLSADVGNPLWNRAFQSGYSPGSTMKCATAVAALEEGVIEPDSVVYCNGTYQYLDETFVCFNHNAHGGVNVKTALAYSCNIFFFECARQLGIEKMNRYASLFGLGQKTGVEISETAGILAGLDYRDSLGLGWKSGETLLAAIGQSDNSFSPLQLTNYCATIANGGTRYVPFLVSKVLSSDYSKVLYERNPKIAVQTNVSQKTLDAVKAGMYLVANETSCKYYLGDLKYKVACKTGTAEKTRIINGNVIEGTDGFLIAFGPYENAEIAITVVIENAGSGSSTAQVAADIFDYYFSTIGSIRGVQKENILLY